MVRLFLRGEGRAGMKMELYPNESGREKTDRPLVQRERQRGDDRSAENICCQPDQGEGKRAGIPTALQREGGGENEEKNGKSARGTDPKG